jgi:hypothetical protein
MFFPNVSTGNTSFPGNGVGEGISVAVGGTGEAVDVAVGGTGDEVIVGRGGGVGVGAGEQPAARMSVRIRTR